MKDRSHSWWWDSHISPKNSKWLQESLLDMDAKVSAMLKLIEEDADSFAKRAEMYYKKRPELVKLVEEFYRSYRSLAERYDNLTGAICKNVSKPLISSQSSDESSIGKHIYDNGRLVHIELPSKFNFSHSKGDGSELEDREDSDTSTMSNSKLDQACETEKETTFASTSDSASSSISDSGYEATNKMHSRNAASNINVNESSQNLEVGNTEVSSTVQDQIPPTGKGHAHYASRIDELQCNLSHLQLENINLQDLAVTRLNEITRLKELYCSIQDENKALKDDISFSLQQITVLQRALHGIDVKGENAMRQGMAGFGKDSGNGLKGAKSGETIKLVDALMKVSDDLFHLQETYQHEILAKDSLNRNLETRIINLQQEMDNFQENLNRLEKENCDLRKVIQNKENIIQKHQEDITMLESLQLNLEASHQAEKLMTELQTRIEKVQEENLNLKSEVGRLKSQYLGSFERIEKENRGLQQLNKRWIGELRKIKGLYDADLTMVKDLLAEMMYFQKQCEALQKEMNGGITYAKELENDILSLKIEKDLLKDDFTWLLYKFREDLSRLLRTKMDLEKALQYEALETHSQGEELKKLQKQLACLQESKTHTDAEYVDELQLAKVQVKELQQEICLLRQKNSECLNRAIHVLPAEDESHAANLDAQLDYPISEDELQQEILNEEKKVMGNLLPITKRMCKLEERVSVLQQEKENVVRSLEARDRQAKHLFVALRSMKKEVTDVVEKTIHLRETTAARFERKWSMR